MQPHKYELYVLVEGGVVDRRERAMQVIDVARPALRQVVKGHHMKQRRGGVFYRSLQQMRAEKSACLFYAVTLGDETHMVIGQVVDGTPKQVTAGRMIALLRGAGPE